MSYEDRLDDLVDALEERLEDFEGWSIKREYEEVTLTVPREQLLAVMQLLRRHKDISMDSCMDVVGVDYADYGKSEWVTKSTEGGFSRGVDRNKPECDPENRFAVTYHLISIAHNVRMRVKTYLDARQSIVDSVTSVWASANWHERETFDLYGILFAGHPDLRRILTDYGFIGHPFRKDFPLIGEVEMRYDAEQRRVIYQPVSIEPRTLVPRVIRDDLRYEEGWKPKVEEPAEADNA